MIEYINSILNQNLRFPELTLLLKNLKKKHFGHRLRMHPSKPLQPTCRLFYITGMSEQDKLHFLQNTFGKADYTWMLVPNTVQIL